MNHTFETWYSVLLITLDKHCCTNLFFFYLGKDIKTLDKKKRVALLKDIILDTFYKKSYPSELLKEFSWKDTKEGEVYWTRVYATCVKIEHLSSRALRKNYIYNKPKPELLQSS